MADRERSEEGEWAKPVDQLELTDAPINAVNLNVDGRKLSGLTRGFGQMWQKTYKVRLSGIEVTPEEVVQEWKDHFPDFWPEGADMYFPLTGIRPGEVGLINISTAGMKLSTGIMVIYADKRSFSFMNPEGHMFAGMITFSADQEEGSTVAQIQLLIRAHDPIWELAMRIGLLHRIEDRFWQQTLMNLAEHFGSDHPIVHQTNALVDPRVQWSEAKNVFKNAGVHSGIRMPVILIKRLLHIG